MHTQELGAAYLLHSIVIDDWCCMLGLHSPEVHYNLFCLLHIQVKIVVLTPHGQAAHLASVGCLIAVVDEAYHSRLVLKPNEYVRAGCWSAVVGQQSKEKGAQHTSSEGPMFNVMVLEV